MLHDMFVNSRVCPFLRLEKCLANDRRDQLEVPIMKYLLSVYLTIVTSRSVDVITSIAAMKRSAMIETPRNR